MADLDNEPIAGVTYCTRCCVPETQEGVDFDEMGVCTACRSSEQKMHIDWAARERQLRTVLESARAKAGNGYDCVLPISGGKDSFYQAHVLTRVYGLKPLAVTFSHNWFSETGFYNLQRCLEVFDLDHLQFTPARGLVNRLAKKSLGAIGDACWHCLSGERETERGADRSVCSAVDREASQRAGSARGPGRTRRPMSTLVISELTMAGQAITTEGWHAGLRQQEHLSDALDRSAANQPIECT